MPKKEKIIYPRHHLQTGNELPDGYKRQHTFTLAKSWRRLFLLSALGALACVVCGFVLLFNGLLTNPDLRDAIISLANEPVALVIGVNLGGAALFYLLHELVHATGLYFYTRTRPRVGFQLFYITLSVPDWYLPRGDFLIITLAPLLIVMVLGLLLFRVTPLALDLALIFGLAMNAASSVGDFIMAVWVLRQPTKVLYEYFGDSVNTYYVN